MFKREYNPIDCKCNNKFVPINPEAPVSKIFVFISKSDNYSFYIQKEITTVYQAPLLTQIHIRRNILGIDNFQI